MKSSTERYPLWMHLEHYLLRFPDAVALLRRLVHQERSAPRPPAGARVIAMGAIKARLTLTDLLCGVLMSFSEGDCTSSLGWPPCVHRTSDRERSEVLCTKRRERSELLRTLVHGATKPEPPKIPAINRQAA